MRMLQEFKEFAIKGNAMDLAVGVIIGAAFGKIVDSIVKDLIMPLAGLVFGKLDFSKETLHNSTPFVLAASVFSPGEFPVASGTGFCPPTSV